jgi:hypothetical protein
MNGWHHAFDQATDALDPIVGKLSASQAIALYRRLADHCGAMADGIKLGRYGECEVCGRDVTESEHFLLDTDIDFVEHHGHLIRRVRVR